MKVSDLIEKIPANTKARVEDAVQRRRDRVRDLIRQELRFKAEWSAPGGGWPLASKCPIAVDEIGYPKSLGEQEIPPEHEVAALLSLVAPTLRRFAIDGEALVGTVPDILRSLDARRAGTSDWRGGVEAIRCGSDFAKHLIAILDEAEFDLAHVLLASARMHWDVEDGILGAYRYSPSERVGVMIELSDPRQYDPLVDVHIDIYWGIVGLVAAAIDAPLEALTVVVLAHELAHYYTHLGFDRDGHRWRCDEFSKADNFLKEGLAQYYTALVVTRLDGDVPGAHEAYERLLKKQPEPYHAHEAWIGETNPEAVGAALAMFRQSGGHSFHEFCREVRQLTRTTRTSR